MKRLLLVTLAAPIFILSCSTSKKGEAPAATPAQEDSASWTGKMQDLNSTLQDLVPYVFDDKLFNDPSNFELINKKTKELSSLAHNLSPAKKGSGAVSAPNADPALAFFATQFQEDLKRAHDSLLSDHRVYARSVIKTSISYCVSCHTRSDYGPKFDFSKNEQFVTRLTPMERAKYFTATRQFDPAMKEFLSVLENPETGRSRPFDIEKAARNALAIAVRVKNDPKEAMRIANDVLNKPTTPLFVKNDAVTWVSSIKSWKQEAGKTWNNETALRGKIKALVRQAESVQRYDADLRGDIYYLRATGLIHDYFNKYPQPRDPAELFFLAGQSYEALKELGFWTLHEMYYERCVREAPHTSLARKCYERFEQSVLLGYSGSAGLFLPASVVRQLDSLRALATLK